eukprot:GCRY01003590.1.p1 GENE.GCRY01003590.1~~GCRY01003590.1.p1  ORF type:complete len:470 (+),score=66.14 GCRY01003590.1:271-1680(+)
MGLKSGENFADIEGVEGDEINLCHNLLQDLAAISDFEKVKSIDLSGNPICSFDIPCLGLRELKSLTLHRCHLRVVSPHIFELPSLSTLNLSHNFLTTFPDQVQPSKALKTINLSNCGLRHLPEVVLSLSSLEVLILKGNRLTAVPKQISKLSCLRELDISFNDISDFSCLKDCASLKSIWIKDMKPLVLPTVSGDEPSANQAKLKAPVAQPASRPPQEGLVLKSDPQRPVSVQHSDNIVTTLHGTWADSAEAAQTRPWGWGSSGQTKSKSSDPVATAPEDTHLPAVTRELPLLVVASAPVAPAYLLSIFQLFGEVTHWGIHTMDSSTGAKTVFRMKTAVGLLRAYEGVHKLAFDSTVLTCMMENISPLPVLFPVPSVGVDESTPVTITSSLQVSGLPTDLTTTVFSQLCLLSLGCEVRPSNILEQGPGTMAVMCPSPTDALTLAVRLKQNPFPNTVIAIKFLPETLPKP